MLHTNLCDLLRIRYPILQGALGPHDTSGLAAAVSRAGGLGVLSTGESDDAYRETRRQISKLKELGVPFGVNLPVKGSSSAAMIQAVLDEVNEGSHAREWLRVVITSAGSPARYADVLAEAKLLHFHVVASVQHAMKAASAGCSGLIAEGYESGGHVSSESGPTTAVLVPAVVDQVKVPVVAAGGFADGRGLVAALALGAAGIQMGTRFYMTCEAEFAHRNIQAQLTKAEISDTVVVPGTYGENRHWRNEYTNEILGLVARQVPALALRELKHRGRMAKQSGDAQGASVPIGMSIGLIKTVLPAEDVIRKTVYEAQEIIRGLSATTNQG
jgi:enoyl-[acyl-carrier protein] reductase II